MTQKPVLKIMKPGKSLDSTDLRDYIFHSDHTCFKIHTVSSGQITINAGGTTGYVDISHNLGYVPAFLVYEDGVLLPSDVIAYADTSKIRITKNLGEPYNQEVVETLYHPAQYWYEYPGEVPALGVVSGKVLNHGYSSACWFQNIYVPQGKTLDSANFEFKNVFTSAGPDIKFKIYGIDEDDTADLGGGWPGGRPRTDAWNNKTVSQNTSQFNFGDSWTAMAQEIVNRGGWSSGNSMAFIFEENGNDNDKYLGFLRNSFSNDNLCLTIKYTTITPGSLVTNYKVVVFKDKIA